MSEQLHSLLEKLGIILEQEMVELTNCSPETLDSWHRRGMGPIRVRLGKNNYYHLEATKSYIDLLAQDRIEKHCELGVADVALEPLRKTKNRRKAA